MCDLREGVCRRGEGTDYKRVSIIAIYVCVIFISTTELNWYTHKCQATKVFEYKVRNEL